MEKYRKNIPKICQKYSKNNPKNNPKKWKNIGKKKKT